MQRHNPFDRPSLLGTLRPLGAIAFLAAVFVGFSWWMWRPLLRDAASTRWPTTPAVVIASGTFDSECGREATLSFAWTVDGRYHAGGHVSFSPHCGDIAIAQAIAASYPVGSKVDIHYDPEHPELAVVRPGIRSRGERAAMAGGEFAVLVLIVAAAWSRFRREAPR